jgi:hypothetical protein
MKKLYFFPIILLAISYSHATIINVPADQPTIQAGINVAVNGDTVLVQPGTYDEFISFTGKSITVASLFLLTQDTSFISQTNITGELGSGSNITFDSEEDTTSILCGFTIKDGWHGSGIRCVSSNPSLRYLVLSNNLSTVGGGILCDNSSPVIQDLVIEDNFAHTGGNPIYARGGGIACLNGSNPTLQNVIVKNNTSIYWGGGMYFENSGASLFNVKVINNVSNWGGGGGIFCSFSNIVMQDVIVDSNFANTYGGGIDLENSDPLLLNVTIKNNEGSSWGWGGGGGIYCNNSNPVILGGIITNNTATPGGGVYLNGSNPSLSGVTITTNTSASGGGVYLNGSNPDLENVIIKYNSAVSGGGMYINASVPVLHNVTLASNFASADGGGMFCTSSVPVFDSVDRSDIYLNLALHGNELYSDSSFKVIVDTFTVLYPTMYHAYPIENFTFDILHSKLEQVEADLYVSPEGDNASSGLTADNPLKNIYIAFSKCLADSLHPHTIHLLEGTYSPETNEEIFPLCIPDYISLSGVSDTGVILNAEGLSSVLMIDDKTNTQILNLTVTGGNSSGISISNSDPFLQNVLAINNPGYGINCSNANPVIENISILNNTSTGFYCENSSPDLLNVKIMNNTSPSNGGGMLITGQSSPVLHGVNIAFNSAAGSGGGLYCDYAIPVFDSINRCNIFLNNAYRANDVYSEYYIKVVVDTFTVLYPTEYHAEPFNLFTFDILNGKLEQQDADLYVSPQGNNSNSGFTPGDPLKTIRFAFSKILTNSQNQNTIHLLEGTYGTSTNGEIFPLYMPDYFLLFGVSDSTVILDAESLSRILIFDYNTGTQVSGFTVTGGTSEKGGGIYCLYSDPVIQDLTITGNSAHYGAGLCCEFAVPHLQDVNIINNTASGSGNQGGGIFCANSYPQLQNLILSGNSAVWGGAICCSNSSANVQNSSVLNNTAVRGGGIASLSATPEFHNVLLSGNTASLYGGAIYIENSYPCLQGIEITDNTAAVGGGIYITGANPVLEGLILTGNSATSEGGGIYSYDTWLELNDALIENNEAAKGGGIYIAENPGAILMDVTLDGNIASDEGGGFYCAGSDPELLNVSITNNQTNGSGSKGGGFYCANTNSELLNVTITNNHANGDGSKGGGIYCSTGSNLSLEFVDITNNLAMNGGGVFCAQSDIVFHNTNRCNIFFNEAIYGSDLYSETLMEVVVDTFTVLYPNCYYANPFGNFTFAILHGKIEQVEADLYVSPEGDNTNSGLTSDDPLKTIRHANSIILADNLHPHTFYLLEGTYSPSSNGESFPVNVVDYISITGESESSVIIDCENLSTVMEFNGNHPSIISDLTLKQGNGNGMSITDSHLDIQNVTISNHTGHGIYGQNSNLVIQNISLSENGGSGIFTENSSLGIENATVNQNNGYGIYGYGGDLLSIINAHISGNSGRGVFMYNYSYSIVEDVIIENNSGGGMHCSFSNPDIRDVILRNNSASDGGGLYCANNSNPYLINVFITGNSVSGMGGGLYCSYISDPYLVNTQITGNTANDNGGGIACMATSDPTFINATIANNASNNIGGAIYSYPSSSPAFINSVLWGNAPHEIYGNTVNMTYSDIQNGWEGEGNIAEDPLFIGSGDYPYALSDDSPCINAGNPDTTGLNLPGFDLAGNQRYRGGRIDMGAYENQNVTTFINPFLPAEDFEFRCSPNPFSDELTIAYPLSESAYTSIEIYNSAGKKVKELSHKFQSEGRQVCQMKTNDLPAGIYFCVLKTTEGLQTKKIIKLL